MNILVLGPFRAELVEAITEAGDTCAFFEDKLSPQSAQVVGVDWILSFGYRYILKEDLLSKFRDRVLNIHISLLPWNRGADPNLWSFLEDSPKGVTLHYIDEKIDTGDIVAQVELKFDYSETLKTSYAKLVAAGCQLFVEQWPALRAGSAPRRPQPTGGTFHKLKDKIPHLWLLESRGWDTPVLELVGKALVRPREFHV